MRSVGGPFNKQMANRLPRSCIIIRMLMVSLKKRGNQVERRNFSIITMIFSFFLMSISGCSQGNSSNSSADWAFSFVVWEGYIYRVSDDYVNEINREIGEVVKYSDIEDTYTSNFSNEYEEGTKFYSIKGIGVEEAIAIKEDGKFRKAIREEKYGEK